MSNFVDQAEQVINLIRHIGDKIKESDKPIGLYRFAKNIGAPSEELADDLLEELWDGGLVKMFEPAKTLSDGTTFLNVNLTMDGWNMYNEAKREQSDVLSATDISATAQVQGNKVFVVHGHDEEILFKTKDLLKKLLLEPIILRELPDEGRTIIEKLVEYSAQAGFAVVLLTPDDIGGSKSDSYENLKLRARQNVILELGLFLGCLGRKHVCILYQKEVEIPSDYQGVLFVEVDKHDAWQTKLAREIKNAGLDVDLNLFL